MKPSIQHQITFLDTSDLNQTAHFYEDILGLKLVVDQTTCRIYKTASSAYLGFCHRENFDLEKNLVVLTMITDEVDAWADYLKEKGVRIDHDPELNERYHIYHFYLSDPNGYKIEIQKFMHPFGDKE